MRALAGLIGSILFLAIAGPMFPARAADGPDVRIDVPVVLKEAKVVFNLGHFAFEGDEPTGLQFLRLMVSRLKAQGTTMRIVAVFHGELGYVLLNDAAYDKVRNWPQGNPYKDQIAMLIKQGVEFEECAQTMVARRWSNPDLLPGVKVNSGANFRIVQLVQEGFVQLQP
jgi:intracellular sulfur oxidation DsrE/DsrF family protein